MTTRSPAGLPAQQVPFPVEPRYLIRPDLQKLGEGSPRFVLDEAWPQYFSRKLELLTRYREQCRVFGGSEDEVWIWLWQVARLLAVEHPSECRVDERGATFPRLGVALAGDGELLECGGRQHAELVRGHLEPLSPVARLADALALAVQEDLVLIGGKPEQDSAALLHVCFPSHWDPGSRKGASFARLHEPVPHNERLMAGSRNLVAAMLAKGPFIRHVWSITGSADLDQNPARHGTPPEPLEGPLLDRLYFRAERQTTTPFGSSALFTIRIYVTPLSLVLDRRRAQLLSAAIGSMDEELLHYKGLTEIARPLLDELDAYGLR